MYLSKVVVQNFRNLKDLELNLSKGLNVILGENNVGKSNLIDAIRVALGSAANTTSTPVRLTKDDLHKLADGTTSSNTIKVSLYFFGLSEEEKAEFLEILDFNPDDPDNSGASIHYEWSWNESKEKWSQKRWGGDRPNTESSVPEENLQALPTTLLGALRDATSSLVPGRASRLARLLGTTSSSEQKEGVETIINTANQSLEGNPLISEVAGKINTIFKNTTGELLSNTVKIKALDHKFEKIVQGLRVVLGGSGESTTSDLELYTNGLGYNNLIYISTVLAELVATKNATLPLLFIEEPEAHLHPQLQILLAEYLSEDHSGTKVQTIVTSHSSDIASHISPDLIRVLHQVGEDKKCTKIISSNVEDKQKRKIQRMLDVTKASLLFSRGCIIVEGISEALLIPALAKRYGKKLKENGISVIPICGVDFATICELFKEDCLRIPVSIITDSDPEIISGNNGWRGDRPKEEGGQFIKCDRATNLLNAFRDNSRVNVYCSDVTLEYDLSFAGESNPVIMRTAFQNCFTGTSSSLSEEMVSEGSLKDKALNVWRAICRSSTTLGKGDFSHELTEKLTEKNDRNEYIVPVFDIPEYIKNAIDHVLAENR